MSLVLHYHPLSSFCHKALIALYENEVAFVPRLVDLGDAGQRAEFLRLWPIGKFPVLQDEGRGLTIPESSIIIEYLDRHHPGKAKLIPEEPELAREIRFLDRFFDLYVHLPMQEIVGDRLRPEGSHDPHGVQHARSTMRTALGRFERDIADRSWAAGASFSLADCSAAPALFYANKVMPLAEDFPQVDAYLRRLMERPSYARVLSEAQPYFSMFPA
ncbi:MAG: glutathione S-transferase family protein [Pseudoxanthomonas sp.]